MSSENPVINNASDSGADVEQVLRDLEVPYRVLPVEAIRAAQQMGPRIVPGLIKLINDATRIAREERDPETNGRFFALFLLIELRAKEAWPEIVEAVTLPGVWPERLYGDAIHEALPRAVSAMAYDRIEEIVSIIHNTAVGENVRWAMITGLAVCVVEGTRSRVEVVALLRGLLVECMLKKSCDNALALLLTLIDLYPAEAKEEMRKAFDEELVYEGEVNFREVEQQIEVGEEETLKQLARRYTPVTDTVEFLRHWAAFESPRAPQPVAPVAKPFVSPTPDLNQPPAAEAVEARVRHTEPRVGRNDPCPCGSGKKFKKCCARSARET